MYDKLYYGKIICYMLLGVDKMARVVITEQLASILKAIRRDNNIAAKELAAYIQKSQSYVSKLENGEIKTVDKEELDKIIGFITADKEEFCDKVDEILKTAIYRYTKEEMKSQVWFSNYSTVYCKIPIPQNLVHDICEKMQKHEISIGYLCERINANEFISDYHTGKVYPRNEWFCRDESQRLEIIMEISAEKLEEILTQQVKKTRYVYLQAIVTYLMKIIKFGNKVSILDEEAIRIHEECIDFLYKYNFYPLYERYKRIGDAIADEEKSSFLSIQDQNNLKLIHKLNTMIQVMSDIDVQNANERLSRFLTNLEWDEGFIFYLVSLNFGELGNVSYAYKQEMLNSIKAILDEAINSSSGKKKIEQYQ